MADTTQGRAKSLAWTQVGTSPSAGPTSPLSSIQSYTPPVPKNAMSDVILGTARVSTSFQGPLSGEMSITSTNLAVMAKFAEGQKFTGLTLTVESAVGGDGTAQGSDMVYTMSHVVVSEVGEPSGDNQSSAPNTMTVKFKLDRHVGAADDPTITRATAA